MLQLEVQSNSPINRKTSMPPRGNRPGYKTNRANRYWMAAQILGKAPPGFPDPCVPLSADATEDEINTLCQQHAARLQKWQDEQETAEPQLTRTRYDGTVRAACAIYQEHPLSAFNRSIKGNTRKSYVDSLKIIVATVGGRLVRNLSVLDQQNWYDNWRKPAVITDANGNAVKGPERIDRAHDAISMWKTVMRFNVALGDRHPAQTDCKRLLDALENAGSMVKFEKGGSRDQVLTYHQTCDFIRAASDLAERGVIPKERALYMSISVAAIFELLLRPKDVLGERPKNLRDLEKAEMQGAQVINYGDQKWIGFFTWERIPGWRLRMKTSKSKYRTAASFDLSIYSMLFPLLEAVPFEERTGAIVKGEHGYAIQERTWRKWFRPIAQAAGIPDDVRPYDLRASGATEADEAGAGSDAVQTLLTHSKAQETTTARYRRRQDQQRVTAQGFRERSRKAGGDGDAK